MGCIGYICKGCGTAIRGNCYDGGELCIMKHVRHGEVLGKLLGLGVVEELWMPERQLTLREAIPVDGLADDTQEVAKLALSVDRVNKKSSVGELVEHAEFILTGDHKL